MCILIAWQSKKSPVQECDVEPGSRAQSVYTFMIIRVCSIFFGTPCSNDPLLNSHLSINDSDTDSGGKSDEPISNIY